MAIGILFEYLLIAALLAPVVWMVWWVTSSLGRPGRQSPVRVSGRPAPASPPRPSRPQPADMKLPWRAGAITVCRLKDGAQVDDCSGPDSVGRCPHLLADGTVPCAGAVLSLPMPIRGSAEWHIPAGYRACLVGSYAAFRQPISAGSAG